MQVIASKCQGNNASLCGWHCFQHQVKTPLVASISSKVPAVFPVTPLSTRGKETGWEESKPSIWEWLLPFRCLYGQQMGFVLQNYGKTMSFFVMFLFLLKSRRRWVQGGDGKKRVNGQVWAAVVGGCSS